MVLAVLLIGYVDYATGYEFSLVLCYFIPIAITAWYETWQTTTVVALLSGLVWFVSDYLTGGTRSHEFYRYWDGIVKIVTFIIVGRTIYRTKQTIRDKEEVEHRLQTARDEIRDLRELLPVCPACRSRRCDEVVYDRTEAYLDQHTGELPARRDCPTCLEAGSKRKANRSAREG